jgi:hypothetical protein
MWHLSIAGGKAVETREWARLQAVRVVRDLMGDAVASQARGAAMTTRVIVSPSDGIRAATLARLSESVSAGAGTPDSWPLCLFTHKAD